MQKLSGSSAQKFHLLPVKDSLSLACLPRSPVSVEIGLKIWPLVSQTDLLSGLLPSFSRTDVFSNVTEEAKNVHRGNVPHSC